MLGPLAATMSVSGLTGLATGYAAKRAGQATLGAFGAAVLVLRFLESQGYVTVHWDRIERDYVRHLDADGDGRVGQADLAYWLRRAWESVKMRGAEGAGFGLGFALGLRL